MNWYGIDRDTVRGNLIDTGNTAAPDGNETFNNTVYGNLVCSGNNPAVEYGDSNGGPNEVGGNATGECGFNVLIPNPSPLSVPGLTERTRWTTSRCTCTSSAVAAGVARPVHWPTPAVCVQAAGVTRRIHLVFYRYFTNYRG